MEEEVMVWGWGAGTDGQIGSGVLEDQLSPQSLRFTINDLDLQDDDDDDDDDTVTTATAAALLPSSSLPVANPSSSSIVISDLACGGAHTIALTSSGMVLTWGRGTQGQLGHGCPESLSRPKAVKILEKFTISCISAGWSHSGFVTDNGCLLTCGDGSFGQLGHGDYHSHFFPVEVSSFVQRHVKQIACGMRHSLALVKGPLGNSLFSFGSGRHGQLGIPLNGTTRLSSLPQIVLTLENETLVDVSANGDHSAALSVHGQLYFWGKSFNKSNDYLPVKFPFHLNVSQFVLGWNHALLLTDGGELLMLGGGRHGTLGALKQVKRDQDSIASSCQAAIFEEKPSCSVERVPGIEGEKVVHIAAGSEHSALVTEKGVIMTWGWGEHGQLGLGNTLDQTLPQAVNLGCTGFSDTVKLKVFCGSGFTFVLKAF